MTSPQAHSKAPAPTGISRRSFVIGASIAATIGLAHYARPTHLIADQSEPLDLEKLIPSKFGSWEIDPHVPVILPPPDLQASINKIYSQVLTRTYRDQGGHQIMLSLAYGRNQTDAVQVHKPEGCYGGQGFGLTPVQVQLAEIDGRQIPVRRTVASKMGRVEPITYWTVIGDTIAAKSWQEKVRQIKYALNRQIPDGLLFRMSSINTNENLAYRLHEQFANDLIAATPPESRARLVGLVTEM